MPSLTEDRIVISGLGLYCPAGPSINDAWESILSGESSLRLLGREAGFEELESEFAAGSPVGQFGPHALVLNMAVRQAGLSFDHLGENSQTDPSDVGLAFGASKGQMLPLATEVAGARWLVADHEQRNVQPGTSHLVSDSPLYPWPPSSVGNDLRENLQITGPATCPVAACASGLVALIQAARWVEWRTCQTVIAGSADYSLTPSVLGAYRRLGVLSNWEAAPAEACRPFDIHRSGFVIGEGSAILIVEAESAAVHSRSIINKHQLSLAMKIKIEKPR